MLCIQNILNKFWLTYHKESSHEICVQLDQWFVRKPCFNILMGSQYERPWLNGQRSTLTFELVYNHCLISFNISRKGNHFGFNSIQKINFSKKSHLNALGSKFDLDVKEAKVNLGSSQTTSLNKLGRTNTPNATYQVLRSSAFWFWSRRFLKGFYHIWAWRPSLLCIQNILNKFWLTYHKESSHEICVQLDQWFVRKLCFNILMGPQYERPWLNGQRSTLTFETCL